MSYCHLTIAERSKIEVLSCHCTLSESFAYHDFSWSKATEWMVSRKSTTACGCAEEKMRCTFQVYRWVAWFQGKLTFKTIYRQLYLGRLHVTFHALRQKGKRQAPRETRSRFSAWYERVYCDVRRAKNTLLCRYSNPESFGAINEMGYWTAPVTLSKTMFSNVYDRSWKRI